MESLLSFSNLMILLRVKNVKQTFHILLSNNLPVTILMKHKLILRYLCCLCLIIKEFHGYLNFHIVPVLCKDRVYQFRIQIVPADRFNHIPRYIVGKLFFCCCWVQLKECFQKCGSVIDRISVYACVCFWCLRLIV